jgi:hypothetical protein
LQIKNLLKLDPETISHISGEAATGEIKFMSGALKQINIPAPVMEKSACLFTKN